MIGEKQDEEVTIYDISQDGHRPITQLDVDRLQAIARAYGDIRYILQILIGDRHKIVPIDWHREAAFLRLVAQKIDDLSVKK